MTGDAGYERHNKKNVKYSKDELEEMAGLTLQMLVKVNAWVIAKL